MRGDRKTRENLIKRLRFKTDLKKKGLKETP